MIYLSVILAGGHSARMGQDKAELIWNNQPLWQHQRQILQGADCENIVVARNQDGYLQDSPQFLHYGPLAGFEAGLNALKKISGDYLLVLPVDMPLITPKIIKKLVATAQKSQGKYAVIAYKNQVFPLILHISTYDKLVDYLSHKRSVQGFIATLTKLEIEAEPDDDFRNTNTIIEWQNALKANPLHKL
ncbi:MAG: molybdenum cofactor guanylyltransferase [Alphaproteobacteria bacterium]